MQSAKFFALLIAMYHYFICIVCLSSAQVCHSEYDLIPEFLQYKVYLLFGHLYGLYTSLGIILFDAHFEITHFNTFIVKIVEKLRAYRIQIAQCVVKLKLTLKRTS